MASIEGLRLKIRNKLWIPLTCKWRGNKLTNRNFTILSNNCWGGTVYEAHNLPKSSPTVGLFFMADDYIKFLSHLKEYLSSDLTFIRPEDSRWKDKEATSGDGRWGTYPIGKLEIYNGRGGIESIEIFFLHYHSEKEAKEKWERRIKRINWNRLLVKFNDQNGCTEEHIKVFDALPYKNKICFTVKEYPQYASVVRVKAPKSHEFIRASYEPFGRSKSIDITKVLNQL